MVQTGCDVQSAVLSPGVLNNDLQTFDRLWQIQFILTYSTLLSLIFSFGVREVENAFACFTLSLSLSTPLIILVLSNPLPCLVPTVGFIDSSSNPFLEPDIDFPLLI